MKPVVTAAQIAAQAYAQSTVQPKRGPVVGQPRFNLDVQKTGDESTSSFRRIRRDTEAFKIEISAEALAASERDAASARSHVSPDARVDEIEAVEKTNALSAFQAIEAASNGVGRREAPFAETRVTREPEPIRRPGFLLDIKV